jgi:hypothetical protein
MGAFPSKIIVPSVNNGIFPGGFLVLFRALRQGAAWFRAGRGGRNEPTKPGDKQSLWLKTRPGRFGICFAQRGRGNWNDFFRDLQRSQQKMAKYGAKAKREVGKAMHEFKEGKLRSGKAEKKVTNPKQAVAIGLSKARKKGGKVPAKQG